MQRSSLPDTSFILHAFLLREDTQDGPAGAKSDHALIEDARNLISFSSTRPPPPKHRETDAKVSENVSCQWSNAKTHALSSGERELRSGTSRNIYEYDQLPPTLSTLDSISHDERSSILREEFLCPSGEEDLYLPRKRRKVAHKRRTLSTLKTWDAGLQATAWIRADSEGEEDEDEVFRLSDLDEFESSDFSSLARSSIRPREDAIQQPKDPPSALAQAQTTTSMGMTTLYDLIPQPHIRRSLMSHDIHPPKKHKEPSLPPFRKSTPHYLSPYSPSPTAIPLPFTDPYARTAWVVPIQGVLAGSLAQATSARLHHSTNTIHTALAPTLDLHENEIRWTPLAVLAFWEFLLRVRDVRQSGSIGISLHLAVPEDTPLDSDSVGVPLPGLQPGGKGNAGNVTLESDLSSRNEGTRSDAAKGTWTLEQEQAPYEEQGQPPSWFCSSSSSVSGLGDLAHPKDKTPSSGHPDPNTTQQAGEPDLQSSLARMDYIKIYHEARYAFVVRNVLHLWGYTLPPSDFPETATNVDQETTREGASSGGAGVVGGKRRRDEGKGRVEETQKDRKKVRLLRGAKLLLVDSRSRGILIS